MRRWPRANAGVSARRRSGLCCGPERVNCGRELEPTMELARRMLLAGDAPADRREVEVEVEDQLGVAGHRRDRRASDSCPRR